MSDQLLDCGDNSCEFRFLSENPGGIRTNGGCRCLSKLEVHSQENTETGWLYTQPGMCKVMRVVRTCRTLIQDLRAQLAESERLLAEARADVRRLDKLEKWLRWHTGNRNEIWNGSAGFDCIDPTAVVAQPHYRLRDAIDARLDAAMAEGEGEE